MLNFYLLLPLLVNHHFFLLVGRSFLEINAKGGECKGREIDMRMKRGKGEAYM
jgi:hypothetical protein